MLSTKLLNSNKWLSASWITHLLTKFFRVQKCGIPLCRGWLFTLICTSVPSSLKWASPSPYFRGLLWSLSEWKHTKQQAPCLAYGVHSVSVSCNYYSYYYETKSITCTYGSICAYWIASWETVNLITLERNQTRKRMSTPLGECEMLKAQLSVHRLTQLRVEWGSSFPLCKWRNCPGSWSKWQKWGWN